MDLKLILTLFTKVALIYACLSLMLQGENTSILYSFTLSFVRVPKLPVTVGGDASVVKTVSVDPSDTGCRPCLQVATGSFLIFSPSYLLCSYFYSSYCG